MRHSTIKDRTRIKLGVLGIVIGALLGFLVPMEEAHGQDAPLEMCPSAPKHTDRLATFGVVTAIAAPSVTLNVLNQRDDASLRVTEFLGTFIGAAALYGISGWLDSRAKSRTAVRDACQAEVRTWREHMDSHRTAEAMRRTFDARHASWRAGINARWDALDARADQLGLPRPDRN